MATPVSLSPMLEADLGPFAFRRKIRCHGDGEKVSWLHLLRNLLKFRLLKLNNFQSAVHTLYHWRRGLHCVNEAKA